MLNKVKDFILHHCLLTKEDHHIVALSGGADSVALLLILKNLGYNVSAAHCNFKLRGEESDRDEAFCKSLCEREGIILHLIHFDTKAYADLHKVSIEMAARELRYNYFANLLADLPAKSVCVAHHKDDSVETVLLNIIRGTGLKGLLGIQPLQGAIVRPLLSCSRKEIIAYLQSIRQTFITDSSNLQDDVKRNKVRLRLLPELRTINPAIDQTITQLSADMAEIVKIVNHTIGKVLPILFENQPTAFSFFNALLTQSKRDASKSKIFLRGFSVKKDVLLDFSSPEHLIFFLLSPFGFSSVQVRNIAKTLHAQSGKKWLSDTHEAVLDRQTLIIVHKEAQSNKENFQLRLPEIGKYRYSDNHTIKLSALTLTNTKEIPRTPDTIIVDREKLVFPLLLRRAKVGDSFSPFGMKGKKLVSDFLTDLKKNIIEKSNQLVLTNADGKIIWVMGLRLDNRFSIQKFPASAIQIEISACSTCDLNKP